MGGDTDLRYRRVKFMNAMKIKFTHMKDFSLVFELYQKTLKVLWNNHQMMLYFFLEGRISGNCRASFLFKEKFK